MNDVLNGMSTKSCFVLVKARCVKFEEHGNIGPPATVTMNETNDKRIIKYDQSYEYTRADLAGRPRKIKFSLNTRPLQQALHFCTLLIINELQ